MSERLKAYERAGADFLARNLQHVFTVVKTTEQQALHNHYIEEIQGLVSDRPLLLRSVAQKIIEIARNEEKHGTTEKK